MYKPLHCIILLLSVVVLLIKKHRESVFAYDTFLEILIFVKNGFLFSFFQELSAQMFFEKLFV